ncbi:hypothetical protein [Photorhabdus heterorhabditis]|uniref:hypothetical protein n=1 Tax=Photorhabdus heterorhabditis TaxID=880156 RepID=UPI0020B79311|nr:hypothetical protein [Photorhabdus heterorhabditis]
MPVTCLSEPARVQLDWCFVDKEEYRLYLSAGREYRLLGDGDVTVFRLTEMQW